MLAEMAQHGGATSLALRQALAAKAYARTAAYDAAIGDWFAEALGERAPRRRAFAGRLAQELRYGENPHQRAAFYVSGERRPGVATATAAPGQGALLQQPRRRRRGHRAGGRVRSCPVGGGRHHQARQPVRRRRRRHARGGLCQGASAAIPSAPYGGIIALNRPIDAATAAEITKILTEIVIAPDASDEAKAIFAGRRTCGC